MIPSFQSISQPGFDLLLCLDPFNRRVRVDEFQGDLQQGLLQILDLSPDWAEKIIIKAHREQIGYLNDQGWSQEAMIPGYFNGEDLYFLVFYPQKPRAHSDRLDLDESIANTILGMDRKPIETGRDVIQQSSLQDAEKLAILYETVFDIYPAPLGDPSYIRKTMEHGTVYVHIERDGQVLSAASAEVNRKFANAELTDCATLPEEQGKGYMPALLTRLEELLIQQKITCLYTICRAPSFGMNKVFYNLGYNFSGCLVNNCNIYSGIENMNVWHKLINR
ncbi:MAG TPA: putative beta-lysine N-acetyltransferase [Saprospiraceae bacterium]|nr:putative beta-lysine N-acetyltransferase [Saprospiraceae bacterium]